MLLHANKKSSQHPSQLSKQAKRLRPSALTIPRLRLNAIDSPTFRPEPSRLPFCDSLELRCAGMKLNARDGKSPEKTRKRISGGIERTATLTKPLGSTAPVPSFASIDFENSHILTNFKRFSENPEEIKPEKKREIISSTQLLLNADRKNGEFKQKIAFFIPKQSYAGLHPWEETTAIPKTEGVLQSWGICELKSGKYNVSALHIGYSFKNLITEFGKLEECTAKYFLRQLIFSLSKLHLLNVTHNRLNLDTILHDSEGKLLINFFRASQKPIEERERQIYRHFFSPQMLQSTTSHKSNKNDVWAVGCIALQFLSTKSMKTTRLHPYNTSLSESHFKSSMVVHNLLEKMREDCPEPSPEQFSREVRDFITLCLQPEEAKRPYMQELLSHPFLLTLQ